NQRRGFTQRADRTPARFLGQMFRDLHRDSQIVAARYFERSRQVFAYKGLRRNQAVAIYVVSVDAAGSLDAYFNECFEPASDTTSDVYHALRIEHSADHTRDRSCRAQRVLTLRIKESLVVDATKFCVQHVPGPNSLFDGWSTFKARRTAGDSHYAVI